MAEDQNHDWPNRRIEILASTIPICVLSIVFLAWRVVYGLRSKRKLLICDYLLILAAMMNAATAAIRFKTTYHGLGRHIQDPSIVKPDDILQYSYFLWIGQVINLLAVAVLKYSICAYLLALNFSKFYIAIVWLSIILITVFNFLIPTVSLFSCRPFEKNWNRRVPGKCLTSGGIALAYTQGASNIITDIVYIVAPLIYLSTIKLPQRTQYGLRVVFCLGLIVTVCSIMKTSQLGFLSQTRDPTWDGTDLAIWSATELSVGILIAALPPLRKQFDRFFRAILPSTKGGTTKPPSIPMYNMSVPPTIGTKQGGNTKPNESDDGSEQGILQNKDGDIGITKTVVHDVISEHNVQVPSRSHSTHRHI